MFRASLLGTDAQRATRLSTAVRNLSRAQNMRISPSRSTFQKNFSSQILKPSSKTSTNFIFSSSRSSPETLLQRVRNSCRSFHNSRARQNGKPTSPNPTPNLGSPGPAAEAEPLSLGARMKKLSREYGWSAFGVYMFLSALDFPFCYLLVRTLGTDRIGEWEHVVVSNVKKVIPETVQDTWHEWSAYLRKTEKETTGNNDVSKGVEMVGWGVEEADKKNKTEASLATQLALAYAIHKSFIFVRVPLTVAILPKVVKVLRGWGWDIGKKTTKETRALNRAAVAQRSAKK